ncbi:peptidyl-tRNA hydrolase, chloroplastic-like [Gossypium australe]|uniref:Peptidyl-tRNA hydrolase, chloroplastic-like n=1 Tax=Gossypium australe TaxID=47621 RepID=A0A5B6W397_9ROSI|nr:peptidyl-tRNA hydrolase, chloroplastic-like [Gossypium australe]
MEKRTDHEDCATLLPSSTSSSSSANNSSKTNNDNSTNLDRFLEFTTPVVSAQYLPKRSIRGCRGQECGLECPPHFEMVDAIAESEGISINNVNFKALLGRVCLMYYIF